jgi:hypothetical protein
MTPRQLEKEALKHAKEQARAEARQQILQAKIDRTFRKEQERAARKIEWQENGWQRVRSYLFWFVILAASIPLYGLPLITVLAWRWASKLKQ